MGNAQETQARQTRFEALMNQGARWSKYITNINPQLSPGNQMQALGMAVIAQELRSLTVAVRDLTDTISNSTTTLQDGAPPSHRGVYHDSAAFKRGG